MRHDKSLSSIAFTHHITNLICGIPAFGLVSLRCGKQCKNNSAMYSKIMRPVFTVELGTRPKTSFWLMDAPRRIALAR